LPEFSATAYVVFVVAVAFILFAAFVLTFLAFFALGGSLGVAAVRLVHSFFTALTVFVLRIRDAADGADGENYNTCGDSRADEAGGNRMLADGVVNLRAGVANSAGRFAHDSLLVICALFGVGFAGGGAVPLLWDFCCSPRPWRPMDSLRAPPDFLLACDLPPDFCEAPFLPVLLVAM